MGGQGHLLFNRYNKSFGHDDITAKHCHFRCSMPLDVDGIDKDDQAAKHKDKKNNVLWPSHLYQNFDPINIRWP